MAQTPARTPGSGGTALGAITLLLFLAAIAALTTATFFRNHVYYNGVTVWESMVKSSPDKRRPHQNYGQALSTAGYLQEALREFNKVLALEDDGSVPLRDVYREIGVVYFRLGRYDDSINAWRRGLVHAPFDAGLLNNLSIALLKLGRYDEAISHAEQAVRTNATMPEPVNTLGEIYLAKGDFSRAAEQFKKYLYMRPEDSRGYWNTALTLVRAGRYEDAYQYAYRFQSMESNPQERAMAQQLINQINANRKGGGR